MQKLAMRLDAQLVDLDDDDVFAFVEEKPGIIRDYDAPVFIDEYQKIPQVLGAIKSKLNKGSDYGQFVLSGSTSFDSLPRGTQNLTGRIQRFDIYPLAQSEIRRTHTNFISDIIDGTKGLVKHYNDNGFSNTKWSDYVDKMLIGGFPLAIQANDPAERSMWFQNYISHSLDRDARDISKIHDVEGLKNVATRLAKTTGELLNAASVANELSMNNVTTKNYISLLESIFVVKKLRIVDSIGTKLVKHPKIHFVDSGIASHLLGYTPSNVKELTPKSSTEFGHIFESFCVNEIIRLSSFDRRVKGVGYWRNLEKYEVDAVVELWDGTMIAFEIKSGTREKDTDYRGIRKFQELAGDRFRAGFVINTGLGASEFKNHVFTFPADCLWRV
jgi:predicted AAA+ superfamily ATPase